MRFEEMTTEVLDGALLGMAALIRDPLARRPKAADFQGRRMRKRAEGLTSGAIAGMTHPEKLRLAEYMFGVAREVASGRARRPLSEGEFYRSVKDTVVNMQREKANGQ